MRLRSFRAIFVLTLAFAAGLIGQTASAKYAAGKHPASATTKHPLASHTIAVPLPPPPPPVDSGGGASAFGKLVVKNLGPCTHGSNLCFANQFNGSNNDFAPTITADGGTMYFVSDRSGGLGYEDFWKATNAAADDTTWTLPTDVKAINSPAADGAASIAADGQTIYFATNRNTTVPNDVNIWVATLDGDNWKDVHEVGAPINTTAWESQPSISADGKKLFFASNRAGKIGGEGKVNVDIFISHRQLDGRWSEPVNLGSKINTGQYDGSPFFAADGTTLYFASAGRGGLGGLDFFVSQWKGPSDTDWTEPEHLPAPINSPGNEMFLTVPASGNSLFFSSDRDGGSGHYDIWIALNPPKAKPTLVLKGRCFDMHDTTKNLGAHVKVVDERNGEVVYDKDANSSTGEYLVVLASDKEGKLGGPYVITGTYPNYFNYGPSREVIPLRDDTSRIVIHDLPFNNENPPVVHWNTQKPQLLVEKPSLYPNFKGVIIREQKTIELFTLLPMVFFDLGAGSLPGRYVKYNSPAQTNGFSEDTLSSTLNSYYNYLNILGLRLRNNPSTTISLTGTNSQDVDQEKSIDLSRERAEGVKKYLVEIWGIAPERMKIEARKLPENPTLPTTPEGIAENRRVEVGSDSWEIVHPVLFNQVVKRPDAATGGFKWENGLREDIIAKRELMISYQGKPWATIPITDPISTVSHDGWNWRSEMGNKLPAGEDKMDVQLKVTDKSGREVLSNIDKIDVKQFSVADVVAEHLGDKTRETYNLILFKYNKSDMGVWNHKILDTYVYSRIQPSSDATVNGYTDILGTDDYNIKLSTNRAKAVEGDIAGHIKGRVKSLTSHGYGKTGMDGKPLYTNDLPEGRYYNRTVQVLVETPINSGP